MEAVQLVALRLRAVPVAAYLFRNAVVMGGVFRSSNSTTSTSMSGMAGKRMSSGSGWLMGGALKLPKIVKAGEPVLHERAKEVDPSEMKSERVQKIIGDMIRVMRKAPGVGLAAPQIGIPLRIIVLEDKEEYMGYDDEESLKEQDRRPFHLLVILNPKLKKKTNRTALFFEGCLRRFHKAMCNRTVGSLNIIPLSCKYATFSVRLSSNLIGSN
ncbi:peptide deformylase 1A, chloroplastic/mitochondrial-like isoform X2 [Vigna umbellata]|uniref:peptide deformylase 1A, chloroplastic/mitochondrial-like isoform X2 n=1 Tax=Vigna umbellata TaxID=87088 RepID=UPI001F5F5810|nr:peptide deformylase 1A, chloroplastic/mitochondrial-like isoform X2 [Vigna umbellata]